VRKLAQPAEGPVLRLRDAGPGDDAGLVALINAAYVVEAAFVRGERIDETAVADHRRRGTFLVAEEGSTEQIAAADGRSALAACVFVEPRGRSGYLGLLSVAPELQGSGQGDALLRAGEERLRAAGCGEVEILVVSERHELFPWYEKRGYRRTGERPFTDVERLLRPCHFVVMRKTLPPV
jgi:ribosomal protein S18 acetylase RimI-like enzyme